MSMIGDLVGRLRVESKSMGKYGTDYMATLLMRAADTIEMLSKKARADRPQEWIPCSERLPKIGEYHISEPCIVYCKGGAYAFAELEENIFGQVGWNCERDDDYHEPIGEVLAWMPLPKPYGEREGE